jgi:hypothetical protein
VVRDPIEPQIIRNLAISQIVADAMDEMGLKLPPSHVEIEDIRRKYHTAEHEAH